MNKPYIVALCPHCGVLLEWALTTPHTVEDLLHIACQWTRSGRDVRYWTAAEFVAAKSSKPGGCGCDDSSARKS